MKHLLLVAPGVNHCATSSVAQIPVTGPGQPYVIEYYYKTKWGHADEFVKLFKKNHYPLLKKEVELGRMLKVWMDGRVITRPKTVAGIIASPSCSRMRPWPMSRSRKMP